MALGAGRRAAATRYLTNTRAHGGRVPDDVSHADRGAPHAIGKNQMMAYLVEMAVAARRAPPRAEADRHRSTCTATRPRATTSRSLLDADLRAGELPERDRLEADAARTATPSRAAHSVAFTTSSCSTRRARRCTWNPRTCRLDDELRREHYQHTEPGRAALQPGRPDRPGRARQGQPALRVADRAVDARTGASLRTKHGAVRRRGSHRLQQPGAVPRTSATSTRCPGRAPAGPLDRHPADQRAGRRAARLPDAEAGGAARAHHRSVVATRATSCSTPSAAAARRSSRPQKLEPPLDRHRRHVPLHRGHEGAACTTPSALDDVEVDRPADRGRGRAGMLAAQSRATAATSSSGGRSAWSTRSRVGGEQKKGADTGDRRHDHVHRTRRRAARARWSSASRAAA